jgi:hypothetical protein
LLIEILPILAIAEPATAKSAVSTVDRFVSTFDDDQRHALSLVTAESNASNEIQTSRHDTSRIGQLHTQPQAYPTIGNFILNWAADSNVQKWLISSLVAVTAVALPGISPLIESFWMIINSQLDDSGRTVRYTREGLALEPPDMEKRPPLVGNWADRQAAVGIWQAFFHVESKENEAAIASLQIASGQTRSARMLRVIDTFSAILE